MQQSAKGHNALHHHSEHNILSHNNFIKLGKMAFVASQLLLIIAENYMQSEGTVWNMLHQN